MYALNNGPSVVREADAPAEELRKYVPVVSPAPGETVRVVMLGMKIRGFHTHYYGGRTRPCLSPASACEGCTQMIRRRWKGYIEAFLPGSSRLCIVELTADAFRRSPSVRKYNGQLRGGHLNVWRLGKARNGPVRCEVQDRFELGRLPESFDLNSALASLWGVEVTAFQPTNGKELP